MSVASWWIVAAWLAGTGCSARGNAAAADAGDAATPLDAPHRELPADAVLVAASATVAGPLGLATCVRANAVRADGTSVPVGPADGLVAESSAPNVAEVRPGATPLGGECSGVLVVGVGEGSAAVTLRVGDRRARAAVTVTRASNVRFGFGASPPELAAVGRELCRLRLRVLVDGRASALLVAEALAVTTDDPMIATARFDHDGTLCLRGERAGTTTLRAVHRVGAHTFADAFAVRVVEALTVRAVTAPAFDALIAPDACEVVPNVEVSYEWTDGAGAVGTYEVVPVDDPRVRCTTDGDPTLHDGRACVGSAPLGSVVRLTCCFEGTCTPRPALVWPAAPGDSIAVMPAEGVAPLPPARAPTVCVPFRAALVARAGARIDLPRAFVSVVWERATPDVNRPSDSDGQLCRDVFEQIGRAHV
jgi:hypothetical protein